MKRFLYITGATLAILVVGALVWGVAIEPYRLDREDITARVPDLPEQWQGEQVALITDFQVGMWLDNSHLLSDIAEELASMAPAAVLIGGDFIYSPVGEGSVEAAREELDDDDRREVLASLDEALDRLSPVFESGVPVYAVLGNHDYAMSSPQDARLDFMAEEVRERIEARGGVVLQNRAVEMTHDRAGAPLYLVGVGSRYAGLDDVDRALEGLEDGAPRIVMAHNPATFPQFPAHSAPLVLSGHTHGGQIRLPGLPQWSWMGLARPGEAHVDGWVAEEFGAPGNRLYVNRGIGFSYVPLRLNAPPELTVVTLERGRTEGDAAR